MRPGLGRLLFGVVILGAGIAVTVLSKAVVWYGAFIVGGILILQGIYYLIRGRGPS